MSDPAIHTHPEDTSANGLKCKLHPILISPDKDEEVTRGPFRPRSNTDPTSPRPRNHVHFNLPEIIVDDCSDPEDNDEDDVYKELANTPEGAFFVFTSPPRQRSNTCPVNMFSHRKLVRPPTPPPNDVKSRNGIHRPCSKEKISFSPHTLSKVTEDGQSSEVKHSNPRPIPQRKTSNPTSTSSPSTTSSNLDSKKTRVSGKQYSKVHTDLASGDPPKGSSTNKGAQHNTGQIKRGSTGLVTHDVMAS